MQSFVAPPKVTRGHRRLKIENIQHISNDLPNGRKFHGESNVTIFGITQILKKKRNPMQ